MNRPLVVVVALATLAFLMSIRPAFGQEQSPAPRGDPATLEKQIAELERRIAPLWKELQALRQQLHEQLPVTVIPVDYIDPAQATDVVKQAFKSTPGFDVEALLKLKCVAVWANATAAREAKDLVGRWIRRRRRPQEPDLSASTTQRKW